MPSYRDEADVMYQIGRIGLKYALPAIVFLVLLFSSMFIVDAGEQAAVIRVGNVARQAGSGLHFKIPFIEKAVVYETRVQKEETEASAASKDLQTVKAVVAVNYTLNSASVGQLYAALGTDYKVRVVDPAIQEAIKAATAKYTAEQLIAERPAVQDEMVRLLSERLTPYYISISDISVIDFDFSDSFNAAIESKVTAEQEALQAKNQLERVKYEAEQRVTAAKAEAEAIRIQAQAITQQGGKEYVSLKWVEKWNGELPATMLSEGATPLINLSR